MTPTVSVVIPTLHRPSILISSLRTVLDQTFDDFEVIVVIDGPDDATARALDRVDDERLHVIAREVNGGCSLARNVGMDAARGAWVAMLDDDDLWRPDKLELQLALAEQTGARWIMCDSVNFESHTGEVLSHHRLGDLSDLPERFVGGNPLHGAPSATLIDRALLREVGGFDVELLANEDFDLWVRLSAESDCVNVDQPLVAYRVSTTSLSTDIDKMKEAGRSLGLKIGDEQVESAGSRYLARQALNGGDRFGAGREFLRAAIDQRSPADAGRAAASVIAPGPFRSITKKRTSRQVDPDLRAAYSRWIAQCTVGEQPGPASNEPAARLIGAAAGLPGVGPQVATRLLDGRHGWQPYPSSTGLIDAVVRALRRSPEAVSVDVFETLLARRVIDQSSIETAVAKRLIGDGLWPGSVSDYRRARAEASRRVVEGSLHDWYAQPSLAPTTDPAGAVEAEIEVEKELTYVLPGAREALDMIRRSPARLIVLSDTYFSEAELRSLLTHHDLIGDADEVIASADERTSKQAGPLYGLAHAQRSVTIGGVHIGNNPFIDGAMAAASGIEPMLVDQGNPTRYEQLLAGDRLGAAVAGAVRSARVERASRQETMAPIEAFGTQVLGAMGCSFLLWIRATLHKTGHRHISFLARDGELPFRMAEAMPSDYWKDYHLEYLHSSRASWSLASASAIGVARWIEVGTADSSAFLHQLATVVPLTSLLGRAGLTVDDLPADSALAGRSGERPIDATDLAHWHELLHRPAIQAVVEERSGPRRDEIVDHLRQTGVPQAPLALVDVGWRGQAAWFVSALIEEATGHEPIHLHFGGDGVLPAIDELIDIRRFAFDDSRRPHPIDSPVSCVEMFLAAGRARLIGYERSADGTVEQRFAPASSVVDTPTVRALWAGAIAVAEQLPSLATLTEWLGEPEENPDLLVPEIRALLAEFWTAPTSDEIAQLEGLRFEHDSSGDSVGRVIRPYRLPELIRRDPLARQWRSGSLVATPQPIRALFAAAQKVRRSS